MLKQGWLGYGGPVYSGSASNTSVQLPSESSESWSPYGDINDTSDNFHEPEGAQISTILTLVGLCDGHSESSESWSPYGDINDTSDNFHEPEGAQNDINNTYSCWVMSTWTF